MGSSFARRSQRLKNMACTAILALGASADSQARQDPAPAPAVQVRVTTITAFAVPLAGQRVTVIDGIVRKIVSARFFVLAGSGPSVPLGALSNVAVAVKAGEVVLSPGQRVVVTGVVRGSLAQKEAVGDPLIGPLTTQERDALGRRPLVIVSSAKSLAQR